MPRYYDTMLDFGEPEATGGDAPDSIHSNPYAIVAVWRYQYPVTYSRTNKGSAKNLQAGDANKMRGKPLLIVEDLTHLTVSQSKTSHIGNLSASLLPGANYMVEIFPGDWVMAWIVHGVKRARSIVRRIRGETAKGEGGVLTGAPLNGFRDGLKFIGRVTTIRKVIQQDPGGLKISSYQLTAASFQEFESSVYYDPYLASEAGGLATKWLQSTGKTINKFMDESHKDKKNSGGMSSDLLIPVLFAAFFGGGVPKNKGYKNGPDVNHGLNDPNAMTIPSPIGEMLGVAKGTKPGGGVGWNDICEILQGIQSYSQDTRASELDPSSPDGAFANVAATIFTPDKIPTGNAADATDRYRDTKTPVLGTYLPSPPQFSGARNVWSILSQYVNPAVNEMFCTLRVNPRGEVFPTLVLRQLPFSSAWISDQYVPTLPANLRDPEKNAKRSNKDQEKIKFFTQPRTLSLTRFVELPRWKIAPIHIQSAEFGRSDSTRFNFMHIYPESGLRNENKAATIIRDPPLSDDLDILRSGLRPYMSTVHCSPKDVRNQKAGDWMYILSDILMGSHLHLSGQMTCVGIQSPIAIGDNVEFDEHLFHIESVTHSFVMQRNGLKSFRTTLQLTHGMRASQVSGSDYALFSGTGEGDLMEYQSEVTREYAVNPQTPNTPPDPDHELEDLLSEPPAATKPDETPAQKPDKFELDLGDFESSLGMHNMRNGGKK